MDPLSAPIGYRGPMKLRLALALALLAGCPKVDGEPTAGSTSTGTTGTTGTTGETTGGTTGTGGELTGTTGGELLYCPGVPEVSEPCLVDADCPPQGSAYCSPYENDCPGAGCPMECQDDGECGPEFVCVFAGAGCCAGQESRCVPSCAQDGCDPGDECLPDGHCAPLACDGAYVCPEGQACSPGSPGADGHGCAPIPCDQPGALACAVVFECVAGACARRKCAVAADCPCGSCVQGECWERPWLCTEPAA